MEITFEPERLSPFSESRYLNPLMVFENKINDLELETHIFDSNHHKTQDKILAALKLICFREQRVLVQFWSPREAGKRQVLITIDQPVGLGVIDEGLRAYRQDSERYSFPVDKDPEEEDPSPAVRVFRQGLPEWTPDLDHYTSKQFLQLECAIRCHLRGYLALPVFDSKTRLCVGVLEILMTSKYKCYDYELQQLHRAFEAVDLRTPQAFDCPILNVPVKRRQQDFGKIYRILKTMCDINNLPLAQTWALSQKTIYVAHEKLIQKSCNSFDSRCVGKVCMSTVTLPFYCKELGMWPFLKASREQHLDRSRSFVGKAFLSRGSCFCEDVTKFSEEEYPLVHNARMNRLTSWFAIFIRSVESNYDYALEFFLPPDMNNRHLPSLVENLKQNTEIFSGFELGENSCVQVVAPAKEVGISLTIDPHAIQISSTATINNNEYEKVTSDSESMVVDKPNKAEPSNILNRWPPEQLYLEKCNVIVTGTKSLMGDDFTAQDFNEVGARIHNKMISYPSASTQNTSDNITDAGEKNNRLKQGRKRKIDTLSMKAVGEHIGKPMEQAAKSLGVSRSTLKRYCREQDMPSWPLPKHGKKDVHTANLKLSQSSWAKQNLQNSSNKTFSLSFLVFLVVRAKRWSCASKRHGFSGKWWSCGRHSYLPAKSDYIYLIASLMVRLRRWRNKHSIKHALHNGDRSDVSESKSQDKHTMDNGNLYSRVAMSSFVHASLKQTVTVKATFKDDTIKFHFPTSLGLLELQHEVTRRIKLQSKSFRLKYRDEDNDLILLACDADLHNLLRFTSNGSTIKLIIQMCFA